MADYPNAPKEYKISSFVRGAADLMCVWARVNIPDNFNRQRQFAREMDRIRKQILGE